MTFAATLLAGDLARIASGCARVAPKTNAIPILGTVRLAMGKAELVGTATDMDQVLALSAPAKGQGSVAVPAHSLAALVATLNAKADVELSMQGQMLLLRQGSASFQLPTLPLDAYPPVTTTSPESVEFRCQSSDLIAAISALSGVVEYDEVRPYLSGLHVEVSGKNLVLVGTDGKGLGAYHIDLEAAAKPPKVIVPIQALGNIAAVAKAGESVKLWTSPSAFGCAAGNLRFQTKVMEGMFPDWRRYLRPKSATTLMIEKVDAKRLSDRLRAADLPFVKIQAGESIRASGVPRLTGGGSAIQTTEEFAAHMFDGVADAVTLSASNLRWVVDSCPEADVLTLNVDGPENPVIVKAPGLHHDNLRVLIQVRA